MTQSQPWENLEEERKFLEKSDGFICKTVSSYSALSGYEEDNAVNLEDMKQEARVEVIKRYRRSGSGVDGIFPFAGTIQNACKAVVASYSPIKIPTYWLNKGHKGKYTFDVESIDILIEEGNEELFWAEFPDEKVLAKIAIDEMMEKATEKEREVFKLLLSGYTPYEISKHYGVNRATIYFYLKKARQYIEEGDAYKVSIT